MLLPSFPEGHGACVNGCQRRKCIFAQLEYGRCCPFPLSRAAAVGSRTAVGFVPNSQPAIQFQLDGYTIEHDELHRIWLDACNGADVTVSRGLIGNSSPSEENYLYSLYAGLSKTDLALAEARVQSFLSKRYPSVKVRWQRLYAL